MIARRATSPASRSQAAALPPPSGEAGAQRRVGGAKVAGPARVCSGLGGDCPASIASLAPPTRCAARAGLPTRGRQVFVDRVALW